MNDHDALCWIAGWNARGDADVRALSLIQPTSQDQARFQRLAGAAINSAMPPESSLPDTSAKHAARVEAGARKVAAVVERGRSAKSPLSTPSAYAPLEDDE